MQKADAQLSQRCRVPVHATCRRLHSPHDVTANSDDALDTYKCEAQRSGAIVTVLSGYDLGFCPRWPRCGPNDATKLNDLSRSAPKSDQSDIRNSEVMTK
jgi:hypothetical protein